MRGAGRQRISGECEKKSVKYVDNLIELDRRKLMVLGESHEMMIEELCVMVESSGAEILEGLVVLEIAGRVVVRGDRVRLWR